MQFLPRHLIRVLRWSALVNRSCLHASPNTCMSALRGRLMRAPRGNLGRRHWSGHVQSIRVTFIDRDGDEFETVARVGESLLELAHRYDIDLEGACDGTLACCTCHLVVQEEWFEKLGSSPSEEEEDMLDMAYGLTDTSRLGCQVRAEAHLDGLVVKIPPYEPQYT